MAGKRISRIFKVITVVILAAVFFSYLVMLLWNWLIPDLFNGSQISIWQAGGLLLLSRLLFGGFGSGWRKKYTSWRHYQDHKLAALDPSEREKLRESLRNCITADKTDSPSE